MRSIVGQWFFNTSPLITANLPNKASAISPTEVNVFSSINPFILKLACNNSSILLYNSSSEQSRPTQLLLRIFHERISSPCQFPPIGTHASESPLSYKVKFITSPSISMPSSVGSPSLSLYLNTSFSRQKRLPSIGYYNQVNLWQFRVPVDVMESHSEIFEVSQKEIYGLLPAFSW